MKIIAEIPEAGYFEMSEHVRFHTMFHLLMSDSHKQPEGR